MSVRVFQSTGTSSSIWIPRGLPLPNSPPTTAFLFHTIPVGAFATTPEGTFAGAIIDSASSVGHERFASTDPFRGTGIAV